MADGQRIQCINHKISESNDKLLFFSARQYHVQINITHRVLNLEACVQIAARYHNKFTAWVCD